MSILLIYLHFATVRLLSAPAVRSAQTPAISNGLSQIVPTCQVYLTITCNLTTGRLILSDPWVCPYSLRPN